MDTTKSTIKRISVGDVFSKLTVLQSAEKRLWRRGQGYYACKMWRCRCNCGKELDVGEYNLLSGNSKSCGCSRLSPVHVGEVYGRLTVVSYYGTRPRKDGKGNEPRWTCQCSCGNQSVVTSYLLKCGGTKSCGCLRKENCLKHVVFGAAAFHSRVEKYKKNAKERGLSFALTKEECKELFSQACFYCGQEPNTVYRSNAKVFDTGTFVSGGIDRLDSNLGYKKDNCVPCCTRCNCGKWTQSKDEFLLWIKTVYERFFKG